MGNSKAQVKVFNVSTGKAVKGGSCKTAGSVLCLTFESTGSQLWAGDSKVLRLFEYSQSTDDLAILIFMV